MLPSAAVASGLVGSNPVQFAQIFRLTLTKSHSYLTDLALRQSPIDDGTAILRLTGALKQAEVTPDGNHLAIPLNDAGLRLWLERKLAVQHLQQGESLRRELVKLSPVALCRVLDTVDGLGKPHSALKSLSKRFDKETWLSAAKLHWKPETPWQDALKDVGVASLSSIIPAILSAVIR